MVPKKIMSPEGGVSCRQMAGGEGGGSGDGRTVWRRQGNSVHNAKK